MKQVLLEAHQPSAIACAIAMMLGKAFPPVLITYKNQQGRVCRREVPYDRS